MNTPFKSRIIGTPDTETIRQISLIYQDICYKADVIKTELEFIFQDKAGIDIDFMTELYNSIEPAILIRQKYVKCQGISFKGIKTEELIKSNLLDIPDFSETLVLLYELRELYIKAKLLRFNYPLKKMYNQGNNTFELSADFNELLLKQFSTYTESEFQNEVLEAMDQLKESINKLISLKLIRPNNLRIIGDQFYKRILVNTRQEKNTFELNRFMFRAIKEVTDSMPESKENEENEESEETSN